MCITDRLVRCVSLTVCWDVYHWSFPEMCITDRFLRCVSLTVCWDVYHWTFAEMCITDRLQAAEMCITDRLLRCVSLTVCWDVYHWPFAGGGDVYPARHAVWLHPAGHVDGVPEQTVARHLLTDHAGHAGTRVNADSNLNSRASGQNKHSPREQDNQPAFDKFNAIKENLYPYQIP